MDLEIVPVATDDLPGALGPALQVYGLHRLTDEQLDDQRVQAADHRLLGARSDGRWVGTLATYPFQLTLPGGASVPMPGLTLAAVASTHRRRGILTALVQEVLDRAAADGAPVVGLLSEEAGIYGRYGFGVATQYAGVHLDAAAVRFAAEPEDPGSFSMPADPAEAAALAEQAWNRHLRWRPGTLTRLPSTWELLQRDRPDRRPSGGGPMGWLVHHDADGEPDGYACSWVTGGDDAGRDRSVLRVHDLVGASPDVEALLLGFLARMDLVHRVEVTLRPVDDHLRWRLVDGRELVVDEVGDFLWLRVLDVAAAFGARTYGTAGRIVVEVDDPRRPDVGGRFAIDGGPDGASCERTTEAPDLQLGIGALGTLLLGTLAPSLLAEAGLVRGGPAALASADALFAATPSPFCGTRF